MGVKEVVEETLPPKFLLMEQRNERKTIETNFSKTIDFFKTL